ncbi:hypothetical protein [Azospirillum sp. ST 5-10]
MPGAAPCVRGDGAGVRCARRPGRPMRERTAGKTFALEDAVEAAD